MVYLKDDLIKNFLISTDLKIIKHDFVGDLLSSVQPMDECLISFSHGLAPFLKISTRFNQLNCVVK
ncbi:hypothetical protein MTQ00_10520 [Chryseobacterium sp. B21-037]|uniref:hypothetical protein n=1 Tax=Chryseobacterium sp. B21-037 TaxID=2926038 RepID=UPI00235A4529|nr:hypothetical protein [Chryseobacterium sp. B21-037]MDC8104974.1 hypothetical protein [Chryseobacterium sp. B21-037]